MLKALSVALMLGLVAPLGLEAQTDRFVEPSFRAGVRVSGRILVEPGTESLEDVVRLRSTSGPALIFQAPARPG